MSLVSPIVCGTEYSFLNILKKVVKKDTDGNYYIHTVGLASDETAPIPLSAEIGATGATKLVITFSEPLNESIIPVATQFATGGNHGGYQPNNVVISGSTVTLTLAGDAYYGDTVVLTYNQPVLNPLQDLAGNFAASFLAFPVTNNILPCAEYTAVVAAMTTIPGATDYYRQHTFVKELVDAGLWTKLDVLYLHAIHTNGAGEALLNWKSPGTYTATRNGATPPSFTQYEGFTGDGATGYLDYVWVPATNGVKFLQNSASQIMYVRTNIGNAAGHGISGSADNKDILTIPKYTTNNSYIRINDSASTGGANTDGSGLFVNTRTASNVATLYRNSGVVVNKVTVSTGRPTRSPFGLAYNDDGVPGLFRADQLSLMAFGEAFDLTAVQNFQGCIERYMDLYGKGVIP